MDIEKSWNLNLNLNRPDLGISLITSKINNLDINGNVTIGSSFQINSPTKFYMDINGDGLIDILYKKFEREDDLINSRFYYYVRFNLGNKFSERQELNGINNYYLRNSLSEIFRLYNRHKPWCSRGWLLCIYRFQVL